MKQKISVPVAIGIAVVALVVICGFLYQQYLYQPAYTAADIAAKFKAAGGKKSTPPNIPSQPKQ